jgi:hypothetical protein
MHMETVRIAIGDGNFATVDASRFQALDSLRSNPAFSSAIMQGQMGRDSQEALSFIVGQLTYTEAQTFERLYEPMQYEDLIPISNEAGEWADSIRYEISDYAGNGKRSSGRGRDINLVDVAYGDVTWPVVNGNIGYDYNTEELRRTAFLRKPVTETKPAAAMDGYRRHMNMVGLYGESESDFEGLYNSTFVPQMFAPNGDWVANIISNPDLVLADVNNLINTHWENTMYNDTITDIVMSPLRLALLAATPRSTNSDKTILQYVIENNIAKTLRGSVIKFTPGYGLDTAGVGGTTRMMGYVKRPDRLIFHIPMPLRFLAPQLEGLSVLVPGEYKYSGVQFRYPLSAIYQDNF